MPMLFDRVLQLRIRQRFPGKGAVAAAEMVP
jgi:hypothetical protein